jgi:hypothetical protein
MIGRQVQLEENPAAVFPRPMRVREKELIESVLPIDRPGYRAYRELIGRMVVLGEGRRGVGNLVLGLPGDSADTASPLPPVIAYGCVETTQDVYSITVRESVGDQVDVEILSSRGGEVPDHFEEKRRWSYSGWLPGRPLPSSGEALREIAVDGRSVLGIAPVERRIILHDSHTGMVHLIPVTNFHNELMLRKGERDPAVALNSGLLFQQLPSFTDDELRAAFIAYNAMKRRVEIQIPAQTASGKGHASLFSSLFRKKKS